MMRLRFCESLMKFLQVVQDKLQIQYVYMYPFDIHIFSNCERFLGQYPSLLSSCFMYIIVKVLVLTNWYPRGTPFNHLGNITQLLCGQSTLTNGQGPGRFLVAFYDKLSAAVGLFL